MLAASVRGGLAVLLPGAFLPDFPSGASLPSARELLQTLPNGAVDNRC